MAREQTGQQGVDMDWTAFGIAALGIFGTLVSPLIAHWLAGLRQDEADMREDQATLRAKLEETYSEIDRLRAQANRASIAAIRVAAGEADVPEQPPLDISRVRVNIGLYFPECAAVLREYDADIVAANQELRDRFEAEPVAAMTSFTVLTLARFIQLADELRPQLETRAEEIRIGGQIGETIAPVS